MDLKRREKIRSEQGTNQQEEAIHNSKAPPSLGTQKILQKQKKSCGAGLSKERVIGEWERGQQINMKQAQVNKGELQVVDKNGEGSGKMMGEKVDVNEE